MKLYDLHTTFTFGQYQGKSLQDVILNVGWNYIEWCILNLDHFALSEEVFNTYTVFVVGDHTVIETHEAKIQEFMKEEDVEEPEQEHGILLKSHDVKFIKRFTNHKRDYERDTFDALTDGTCGDYEDFESSGMGFDTLRDSLGF